MSFVDVHDNWNNAMPISSEFSNGDYYQYLPLKKLIAKIQKHQLTFFRCRCIGVFACRGHVCTLHDLDDKSIEIRLSLKYLKSDLPCLLNPFTVQLFGSMHWHSGIGPVLYIMILKVVDPPIAQKLARTMKWIVHNNIRR